MVDIQIGATIRARRVMLGMTLSELASASGTTKSRISELENDKRPNPTISRLSSIANALGIRLSDLILEATGTPRKDFDGVEACPFCGGEAVIESATQIGGEMYRYVSCMDCSGQADPDDWRHRVSPSRITALESDVSRLTAENAELRAGLTKIANLTGRCEHDGGFDREIGQIGCLLGDKCVCVGIHPIARASLSTASSVGEAKELTTEIVDAVAEAIRSADVSYGMTLIRLVDGVHTYSLRIEDETLTFVDNEAGEATEQLYDHVRDVRRRKQAAAVVAALSTSGGNDRSSEEGK